MFERLTLLYFLHHSDSSVFSFLFQENKSLKMVLEGNNGHRPLTPMGDLDKVTLTQLANDLFRRLQDVEEQRREAQRWREGCLGIHYIEAETKLPTFYRHFHVHLLTLILVRISYLHTLLCMWLRICVEIKVNHDDGIKWKHFPCYWPFVLGIHLSPVNSPHSDAEFWCFLLIWPEQTVE